MNFIEHLRQFFDPSVADDELEALALHAIATDVRRLKPAISQAVWDSRQLSGPGGINGSDNTDSAKHLDRARQLQSMYVIAMDEFTKITSKQLPADRVADHFEPDGGSQKYGDNSGTRERQ